MTELYNGLIEQVARVRKRTACMAGYIKRIALIKTVGKGFSSDGGQLGGLVKCEAYAGFLKAELSLINFAPLAEGRYRCGLSDGISVVVFDGAVFEAEINFELSRGFAALVCFCKDGDVLPVASAVCGDNTDCLAKIERAVADEEKAALSPQIAAYEDEAIAEVNYYELETGKGGRAVREDKKEEADGRSGGEDETYSRACESARGQPQDSGNMSFSEKDNPSEGENGGGFFERMQGDVRKIFADYPKEERLERVIDGSRWAKIGYGGGRYYAFGIIYADGEAKYLCYGVPSADGVNCPRSLAGRAAYIPVEGGGYWIMYQDANTGVSIKIDYS